MGNARTMPPIPAGPAWAALGLVSAGAAVFYALMEWTFFATKPSFMSTLGAGARIRILLFAPLPLVAASAALCAALGLGARIVPRARGALVRAGALGPGFLLAAAGLLLLDNFTYTLFRVGVQTAEGFWRFGYLAVFGLFWAQGWRWALGGLRGALAGGHAGMAAAAGALVLAALWGGLAAAGFDRVRPDPEAAVAAGGRPNILLLASDGLSAEFLSLYGYARDTTPFLRAFAEGRALVCENAGANSLNSSSSIASLLAGKWPTTLRLYYPPEILTGKNAYEHLPGLLRQQGYENVDISARQFADAYDLNLLHGFDEANGRAEARGAWRKWAAHGPGMNTVYFWEAAWERLRDRLLHAAGIRDFESAYEMVAEDLTGKRVDDTLRIERLLRLIAERRDRPFFAHVHLLATHGPRFHSPHPAFSAGRTQTENFEQDFYDDALRDFDAVFRRIVQALEAAGQLDRTVLILSSDHGKSWSNERIPLAFWFPSGAFARRISTNAQNLDVAPTLLDYLGLPIPDWMEGASLLREDPPARRPIFCVAADSGAVNPRKWRVFEHLTVPPFYSLGSLAVSIGDRAYSLDLKTGALTQKQLSGHTSPLAEAEAPSEAEARQILLKHLEDKGYEVPDALRSGGG